VPLGEDSHLRLVSGEADEAEALGLACLDVLLDLRHKDLAKGFKVLAKFGLSRLPGQTQHDQVGALVLLHFLVLGRRRRFMLVVVELAFVS